MKITYVKLEMKSLTALSVSAPESNLVERSTAEAARDDHRVDMPLHRGADGAVVIPGSTIAGNIRALLPAHLRVPMMGTVDGGALASPLLVLDARVVQPADGAPVVARRRTAIDRQRGAAATNKLFDGEAAPAGSAITVLLELHDGGDLLEPLLDCLRAWQPQFGRGATTGSGFCFVETISYAALHLGDDSDLLRYLNMTGPGDVGRLIRERGASVSPRSDQRRRVVERRYEVADVLHVGSGRSNGNVLLMERDAHGRPLVPGSSIKGVLRSRSEFILRSIGVEVCDDGSCGACPTCRIFGYTLPEPDKDGRTGGRGLLAFHDAPIDVVSEVARSHVAIDRVTGGARDSALYSTQSVDIGSLDIRVEALADLPEWAPGLLWAALRDVDDGYVGFGSATTRGYGTLHPASPAQSGEEETMRAALASLMNEFPEGQDR